MSDFFKGQVLRGTRVAPSNAITTSEPTTGVSRHTQASRSSSEPPLVEINADQYRASVLNLGTTEEFLIWSANTASITTIEDFHWAIQDASAAIPNGTVTVNDTTSSIGVQTDGSPKAIVLDKGNRSIAEVFSFIFIRGDDASKTEYSFSSTDFTFSSISGALTLNDTTATRTATTPSSGQPPAFSLLRGDQIKSVTYTLAAARFWWTKNDPYQTRFGWDGALQRWRPLKGGATKNVGQLLPGVSYNLSPRPLNLTLGSYLPGSTSADDYAMIRLGSQPDVNSQPISENSLGTFTGILVVPNESVSSNFGFNSTTPPLAGVIGETSGQLEWNPSFTESYAGSNIWYSQREFESSSDGVIGKLLGSDQTPLFISPIPGPNERPIIRIGSRSPLSVVLADTDAELEAIVVSSGSIGVSLTTGKLRFNSNDVALANPSSPAFDPLYLGVQVVYGGVTGNLVAQPLRAPVLLVGSSGQPVYSLGNQDIFIPDADLNAGIGVSGVVQVPDGTGVTPNTSVTPQIRPNGSGLVREVVDLGESIVFSGAQAIEKTVVVDTNSDLPQFEFSISSDEAIASREKSTHGSQVKFSKALRKAFQGSPVYFLQTVFTPAAYARKARLYSRIRDAFTLSGLESLYFSIDGTEYVWHASFVGAGVFTATEIASSIASVITGTGGASSYLGRVVLSAGNLDTGSVEIQFGSLVANLSGCQALGFLPGWRVDNPQSATGVANNPVWLPDSGSSIGVFRTPANTTRRLSTPDFNAVSRIENENITDSISPLIFQFLNQAPLEDVAGFDVGKFFQVVDGPFVKQLEHLKDIQYLFSENKFSWLGELTQSALVESPTSVLSLGRQGVVPESLLTAVGGQFEVSSDGGVYGSLTLDKDFILPFEGGSGIATLIKRYGSLVTSGARGRFSVGDIFNDDSADFSQAQPGYRLKLTSGLDSGSYHITEVISSTRLKVAPPFIKGSPDQNVSWQLFEGISKDKVDPSLVSDVSYTQFQHLPEETFKIKTLKSMGTTDTPESLLADVSAAVERNRKVWGRVGLNNTEIAVTYLRTQALGAISNGALFVPDTSENRFTSGAFSIQVGSVKFTAAAGTLVSVAAFTNNATAIEYLNSGGSIGLLNFGATVLDTLAPSEVYYVEELRTPADIPSGELEVDPQSGAGALSALNATPPNTTVYFVQEMIAGQDVTLNPLGGDLNLSTPLLSGETVEVAYSSANTDGTLKTDSSTVELLPIFIRGEVCTRLGSSSYSFNPLGRTLDSNIAAQVSTGARLKTYGATPEATVNYEDSTITFTTSIKETEAVKITYAVYEATGGETSFSVSKPPVYRPPFFLKSKTSSFVLEGARSLTPGQILVLGEQKTYLKSVTYDAALNQTSVEISPSFPQDAGSLSPGNDTGLLISDRPVTPTVDPNGVPVSTTASIGILPLVKDLFGLTQVYFEPAPKGSTSVRIQGNLSSYVKENHILEIGGTPFQVSSSEVSEDGLWTTAFLVPSAPRSFSPSSDSLRVSVRPLYQPDTRNIAGLGPLLPEEGFEVVLFGEVDATGSQLPGRTLIQKVDYEIDASTGAIVLLAPQQKALQPNQEIYLSHTRLGVLSPFLSQGVLQKPRYRFKHRYQEVPSKENGLEGATLQATYSFENPDTFYYQSAPLSEIASDVSKDLAKKSAATNPSSGPILTTGASTSNQDQGRVGLESEGIDLASKDRAARRFLKLYNEIIIAFEQVLEATTGDIVGDRDGKFRFNYGSDFIYAPPGSEDQIAGVLNPRNVFLDVFNAARGGCSPIFLSKSDNIVNPLTATVNALGEVSGSFLAVDDLQTLIDFQENLIKNDVDDLVLIQLNRGQRKLTGLVKFKTTATGSYRRMGEPHKFSRIFPEQTSAFTTLNPGVFSDESTNSVGVYTAGRVAPGTSFAFIKSALGGQRRSTTGKAIGSVSNPVLGTIENIQRSTVFQRLPRARVWAYFPKGNSSLGVSGKPCLVATPLPLNLFPVNGSTGLPDTSQLFSQGGTLYDLVTGDADLDTPPFKAGQQLAIGFPEGQTSELACTTFLPIPITSLGGVFVDQVINGCVVTFKDTTGVAITSSSDVLVKTSATTGTIFSPSSGDTLYVIPLNGETVTLSDPLTQSDLAKAASTVPNYRVGFDIGIDQKDGQYIDITLPSTDDPSLFATKEWFGQNPPTPLSAIESIVTFSNGSTTPLLIPALQGLPTLDNGDRSLPYLTVLDAELEALSALADSFTDLFVDSPDPPAAGYVVEAIYPDETVDNAGVIAGAIAPPVDLIETSALVTTQDLFRKSSSGAYPPPPGRKGVGDLSRYDLLFIQTDNSLPEGSMGILSVGDTGGTSSRGRVEPPRFVTPIPNTMTLRYNLVNGIVHESAPLYADGFLVTEVVGATVVTTFNSASIAAALICYDNDSGGGALAPPIGGFNHFFSSTGNASELRIKMISAGGLDTDPQGTFATPATIIIRKIGGNLSVSGDNGSLFLPANSINFTNQTIQIDTAASFFDFTRFDSSTVGTTTSITGFRGFACDIEVPNSVSIGSGGTATIEDDRLTFTETFNLSSSRPRGATHSVSGVSLETSLDIKDVDITLSVKSGGSNSYVTGVNSSAEINGGVALTFLSRGVTASSAYGIGTFTSGTSPTGTDSISAVKAMAFEGHLNAPIEATGITFSAAPSSSQSVDGPILSGKAIVDRFNHTVSYQNVLLPYEVSNGSMARIEKGDICTIQTGLSAPATPTSTVKTGTYLVRGSVPPETVGTLATVTEHKEVPLPLAPVGGGGWINFEFPKVVSFDAVAGTLTVDRVPQIVASEDNGGTLFPAQPIFHTTGSIYILVDLNKVTSSDPSEFNKTLIKIDYLGLADNVFTLDLPTATDPNGNAVTDFSPIEPNQLVSGMRFLPVSLGEAGDLNLKGLPGFTELGATDWLFGFPGITVSCPLIPTSVNYTSDAVGALPKSLVYASALVGVGGNLGIYQGTVSPSNSFLADSEAIVYPEVPTVLDLSSTPETTVDFTTLHTFTSGVINCLLPIDTIEVLTTSVYKARAGVFLEPSFPRPVNNLRSTTYNVVSSDFGPLVEVGERDINNYVVGANTGEVEAALIEIRRMRRFHSPLDTANLNFLKLRSVYEIRRGSVSAGSYVSHGAYGVLNVDAFGPSGTATQVGNFNDPSVNINAGDTFRLLESDGRLIEEVEILAVSGARELILNSPGLQTSILATLPFEIYLKQAVVPHEQSNEMLLSLVSDQILLDRRVDFTLQNGGVVNYISDANPLVAYTQSINTLRDTDPVSNNFSTLGVQEGDYVIIDPAGEVSGPSGTPATKEIGSRPFGDLGILDRVLEAGVYVPGAPSELDDNRGYYRVKSVDPSGAFLSITAEKNILAGDFTTGDQIIDSMYVVYPTVHASTLSGGIEGQNDLRPTSFAGQNGSPTNSFKGNSFSVGPFGYKIIRPSKVFKTETVELILAMRERMLSWIEEIKNFLAGNAGGSYFVFQRDNHIKELGSPTDPSVGLGLVFNLLVETVQGRVEISPFTNTSDCLSILDRRFWVLDTRLDNLRPPLDPTASTYSSFLTDGGGRPVLPDRINEALNQSDNFRQSRYAWLNYRTNRVTGILSEIRRFESEVSRLKVERQELLKQIEDTENDS